MKKMISRLIVEEQAASMAEYALLLALVSVAVIGALQILQGSIVDVFTQASTDIESAIPAS